MKTVFNVRYLSKINKINYNKDDNNNIIMKLVLLLSENKITISKDDNEYEELSQSFCNYGEDVAQLQEWVELEDGSFKSYKEAYSNELVDYLGEYHKVMKELFSFNRFWSKEKLFFDACDNRFKNVKYKVINYYTRNFQRPIVYPILDYKYRYPEFASFKVKDDFYKTNHNEKNEINIKKIEDDYNFNLDCPEFKELVKNYHMIIYKKLSNKQYFTDIFNICLVKQLYHVKGTLFYIYIDNHFKIIFFSNPYDFTNGTENTNKCNKKENKKDNSSSKYDIQIKNFCHGQIFKCPQREKNRKIEIKVDDIRMILYRIYYYRKSAIEIFTETKSYFFNFFSVEDFTKFKSKIEVHCSNEKFISKNPIYFMPLIINSKDSKENIGYIKINGAFDKNQKIDFIDFISNSKYTNEMCNFDTIMFMNLIANRSYLDLNQYPVFPVLFFCEKQKKIERNFKLHIGFQNQNDGGKKRCEIIKKQYNDNKSDRNDNQNEGDEEEDIFYFNTHYSNIVYVTNFLIRLFPYSFCAIELQGNNFDEPNRLFYSIEKTLFNLITQLSDIRELIPEFFYLPEMLMNINNINFPNGSFIDDVEISENVIKEELTICNQILDIQKGNYYRKSLLKIFIFIVKMKNNLENLKENLSSWLNIIFGTHQKYLKKNKGQLFRTESYIDIDEDTFKKYSNDDIIMKSVEFGLIPLQIVFDSKNLNNIKYRKPLYNYNLKNQNQNIINNLESPIKSESEILPAWTEKYWDNNIKLSFKIKNGYGSGKFKIYNNNILIDEIVDHSDEILDIFYNRRLNMFATCSYDGFICTYIFPNKLISIIKHPNNLYFNNVRLSANPFPTIIAYEKQNNCFYSYSLNGIFINKMTLDENKGKNINKKNNEEKKIFSIIFNFDMYGGCHKDRLEIIYKFDKKRKVFDIPFFNEVK